VYTESEDSPRLGVIDDKSTPSCGFIGRFCRRQPKEGEHIGDTNAVCAHCLLKTAEETGSAPRAARAMEKRVNIVAISAEIWRVVIDAFRRFSPLLNEFNHNIEISE